jgi:hypothetical protein
MLREAQRTSEATILRDAVAFAGEVPLIPPSDNATTPVVEESGRTPNPPDDVTPPLPGCDDRTPHASDGAIFGSDAEDEDCETIFGEEDDEELSGLIPDDEEEEEREGDGEEDAEHQTPELAQLFMRVAELRQRVMEIGGPELTPHLLRLRTLLEQVRDLSQGLEPEAIEASTITMTLASKPCADSAGDVADAAQRQCMICLEEFQQHDQLRVLPCFHRYHTGCVDNWFARSRCCPVCKHDVTVANDTQAILCPLSSGAIRNDDGSTEPAVIELD